MIRPAIALAFFIAFILACYGIGHALAALVLLIIPGTP